MRALSFFGSRKVLFLASCTVLAIGPVIAYAGDPLDNVAAYSLEITSEGVGKNYVPIGMRPGLPGLTVHAGFNLWQSEFTPNGIKQTGSLEADIDPDMVEYQEFGLMSFAQIRGALSLSRGKPVVPGFINGFGTFPPAYPRGDKVGEKGLAAVNVFYPGTRSYLLKVATEVASKIGAQQPLGKPIVFWGLDNEYEGFTDYSPEAKAAFFLWLQESYANDVSALNQSWELSLKSFDEVQAVPVPAIEEFRSKPGQFLDWHTFQSNHFTKLLVDMGRAAHEADPFKRGVVFKSTQQTIEMPNVNRIRTFDHALFADQIRDISGGLYGINTYGAGDRQAYETSYAFNCIRSPDGQGVWGVMYPETNNHSGPGFQWAASFWRYLNNGVKAVNFFCTGYPGAKKDYASFGHVAPDGKLRDKMFYAARWAQMIHRTEALWHQAMPAPGTPKVALFVPRRDITLAETTDRIVSKWAYPSNHRWMIYKWLREQGYWVDAIPYTKLQDDYLAGYQAVMLCGAEHLTDDESQAIRKYVANGGTLISDERPGFYNEHHIAGQFLADVVGAKFESSKKSDYAGLDATLSDFVGRGIYTYTLAPSARVLLKREDGSPLAIENAFGKGKTLHFFCELGSIRRKQNGVAPVSTFKGEGGETADPAVDAGESRPLEESNWLGAIFTQIGLAPAYAVVNGTTEVKQVIRVEAPFMDEKGNAVFSISTRASDNPREKVPASEVEMWLPSGNWKATLIGPAEHAGLEPLQVTPAQNGRYRIQFPDIRTAAIVYLFQDYPAVLGIPKIKGVNLAIDGQTARVEEEKAFTVKVQFFNPGASALSDGKLRLLAKQGWDVSPAFVETKSLASGAHTEFSFTVTASGSREKLSPDWIYPLVARWSDSTGKDAAICAANVQIVEPPTTASNP